MERKDLLMSHLTEIDGAKPCFSSPLAKHLKMSRDPFLFFRGSASLFYRDIKLGTLALPKRLLELPKTFVMGDCHLSNFGFFTEEGSHGDTVIFALNDFDDACVGHATWDISRFIVSLYLAADYATGVLSGAYQSDKFINKNSAVEARHAESAASAFLSAYVDTCAHLDSGESHYAQALDGFESPHILAKRFDKAMSRSSKGRSFMTESTIARAVALDSQPLSFKLLESKFERLDSEEYTEVVHTFAPFVDDEIIDVVKRVGAGTGSNHLGRYYLLVGPKAANELQLDLCHVVEVKQQQQAAALRYFSDVSSVNRLNPAHLTVKSQCRMQRNPDLTLDETTWRGKHWLIRSRHHAKVSIKPEHVCFGKKATQNNGFVQFAATCGEALALSHARGDRRSTSFEKKAVELVPKVSKDLILNCSQYAEVVKRDWEMLKASLGL